MHGCVNKVIISKGLISSRVLTERVAMVSESDTFSPNKPICRATGVADLLMLPNTARWSSKTIRSAMGTTFQLLFVQVDSLSDYNRTTDSARRDRLTVKAYHWRLQTNNGIRNFSAPTATHHFQLITVLGRATPT
jgi:hypothetical protein